MLIIVYSETDASNITSNLGVSEYSYYFVLQKYLPILEKLGEVVHVRKPALEVDALYRQAIAKGDAAVFMSFSPPHRTELELECPTICVLAWEFSSIPDESWGDDPRDNWVETIARIGNIIAISQYSTDVIRAQLGQKLNISTVPAPVTDLPAPRSVEQFEREASFAQKIAKNRRSFSVVADVIDTTELEISDDIVCFSPDMGLAKDLPQWNRNRLELVFDGITQLHNGYRYLVGFHDPEEWGAWSRSDRPWISLPVVLQGDFSLEIALVGFESNDQKDIRVQIGNQSCFVKIDTHLKSYTLEFTGVRNGTSIEFFDLEIGYTIGAELLRALSLGVAKLAVIDRELDRNAQESYMSISRSDDLEETVAEKVDREAIDLDFEGLVYTSIFNPEDGRKNWEDIVTAFCWAFRDDPSKTLILKFTCPSMSGSWGRLFLLFSQLNPFSCRIVVIHGYLTSEEMKSLVSITDFFVNASKAEGQCLPLLEFMAEGVPAIAPDHTAMASYIDKSNALVVESSLVATCWPQDPREYDKTFFYRIDWSSLHDGYVSSAKMDALEYREMSFNAASLVREQFSVSSVDKLLADYLHPFSVK